MPDNEILTKYGSLKDTFKQTSAKCSEVTYILRDIYNLTRDYLIPLQRVNLTPQGISKQYFAFNANNKYSRSVNSALYTEDAAFVNNFWSNLLNNTLTNLSAIDITRACYTIAISFCCYIDLIKSGDQKTPGTYFEYFVGHLYSKQFDIEPSTQLDVLNLDMRSKLPTDFIFDQGTNKPKYHIPVKTSTRERVIQVWAHQRVLDGVYGTGRFFGLLTCLSETKLDHTKLNVTEICLPDQWRIYQLFIAQMKRIYYLDVPTRYAELNNIFPKIHVKQFGEFFHESTSIE